MVEVRCCKCPTSVGQRDRRLSGMRFRSLAVSTNTLVRDGEGSIGRASLSAATCMHAVVASEGCGDAVGWLIVG